MCSYGCVFRKLHRSLMWGDIHLIVQRPCSCLCFALGCVCHTCRRALQPSNEPLRVITAKLTYFSTASHSIETAVATLAISRPAERPPARAPSFNDWLAVHECRGVQPTLVELLVLLCAEHCSQMVLTCAPLGRLSTQCTPQEQWKPPRSLLMRGGSTRHGSSCAVPCSLQSRRRVLRSPYCSSSLPTLATCMQATATRSALCACLWNGTQWDHSRRFPEGHHCIFRWRIIAPSDRSFVEHSPCPGNL